MVIDPPGYRMGIHRESKGNPSGEDAAVAGQKDCVEAGPRSCLGRFPCLRPKNSGGMSHYTCLVIMPKGLTMETPRAVIDAEVEKLLAPFDENTTVDEYDRPCHCIGARARNEAGETAAKELDTSWEKLRDAFNTEEIQRLRKKSLKLGEYEKISDEEAQAAEGECQRRWQSHTQPLRELEKKRRKEHPLFQKPDPECDECHGSGTTRSTYNPNSKWDWYCVGGRWGGALLGLDPEENPKNKERCQLCGGTGTRKDALAVNWSVHSLLQAGKLEGYRILPGENENNPLEQPRIVDSNGQPFDFDTAPAPVRETIAADLEKKCNGCSGTGIALKWPTDWEDIGNICLVHQIKPDFSPFAFLTPDGQWIEEGEMGWFAVVSNKKDPDVWGATCVNLLTKHKEHLAVLVDCHI